eukprot:1978772-Pyramimonas_sp.AAC.1
MAVARAPYRGAKRVSSVQKQERRKDETGTGVRKEREARQGGARRCKIPLEEVTPTSNAPYDCFNTPAPGISTPSR